MKQEQQMAAGAVWIKNTLFQTLNPAQMSRNVCIKLILSWCAGERAARAALKGPLLAGGSDYDEDEDEDDDEDCGEGGEGEESEVEESSGRGASAVSAALEALQRAREQLAAAEGHVKAYSRTFQFDALEHQELSDRLKTVRMLEGKALFVSPLSAQGC